MGMQSAERSGVHLGPANAYGGLCSWPYIGETKAEARSWINKRSSTTFFVPFVFVSPSRSSHLRERDARNNFSQPGKRDSSWSFIFFFFFFFAKTKVKKREALESCRQRLMLNEEEEEEEREEEEEEEEV